MRDQAGRPLHEVDFREDLANDVVVKCPYPGSRNGFLMNRSALKLIASEWTLVKESLSALVWHADAASDGPDDTSRALWIRALYTMFVPLYVRCVSGPRASGLPTSVSGLFKVMLDVPTTIDLMLAADWANGRQSDFSAAQVAAFAEDQGILNNGSWTCAGPPTLIDDLLQRLEPRGRRASVDLPLFEVLDIDEYVKFAAVAIVQYAASQAFQVATASIMERAWSSIPATPNVSAEPLPTAYDRRRAFVVQECVAPERAVRVVAGFANVSRSEHACGAVRWATPIMRALEASRGASPVRLLELQLELEAEFGEATACLQRQLYDTVGREPDMGIDPLALLASPSFPSRLLERALDT